MAKTAKPNRLKRIDDQAINIAAEAIRQSHEPVVPLYRYQKRWLLDKSRFKIGLFSRQTGKSFVASLEAVLDIDEYAVDWIMLSAGMRQSLELMEKVKMHCQAIKIASSEIDSGIYKHEDIEYTLLKIVFNNGAKIQGLPANPDTARGFTGNVHLDEFAFHTNSFKIWSALFPTVSRCGYKLRITTTPQGFGNKTHELWNNSTYSKHFVDIYTAIKDGCPQNAEELKEGLGDDEAWAQEFECQFIDDSSILLSYEMITACQDVTVTQPIKLEEFSWDYDLKTTGGPLYAGLDVGRKKDLSVLTIVEQVGDVYWDRLILEMPKTAYTVQREFVGRIYKEQKVKKLCVDATGIGSMLAETLGEDLGSSNVESVTFTNSIKNDMATRMLHTFQDRKTRIPVDRNLRDDLHKIKKSTTSGGNVKFDASSDDQGHADRFWSKALALQASADANPEVLCIWL